MPKSDISLKKYSLITNQQDSSSIFKLKNIVNKFAISLIHHIVFNLEKMSKRKIKIKLKERKWLWGGGMVTNFDHFVICIAKYVSVDEKLILFIKK